MRRPRGFSLRTQLLLTFGGVMGLALTTLLATLSRRAAVLVENEALAQTQALAQQYAAEIGSELESAFEVTRTLALSVDASIRSQSATRAGADSLLSLTLHAHPELLGTWLGFEPNAFDGRDVAHVHTPYHDETGRFFPGWVRDEAGAISKDVAPEDHEYERPGDGDWYLLPMTTRRATVLDPYFYPVNGKDVLMTSLAVPLVRDGRFIGVAGIDISLAQLQERLQRIRPLGTGRVALVAGNGTYVAHPDAGRLGKPVDDSLAAQVGNAIRKSGASTHDDRESVSIYVPVQLAGDAARWLFVATIPRATVLAHAAGLRHFILLFGLAALLGLVILTVLVVRRITRPIEELSAAARAVAAGDIERVVSCRASGEIGVLADAFRQVIDTIRDLTRTTDELVHAAATANLSHRADVAHFQGAYARLVRGMNDTMAALATLTRQSNEQRDEAVAFLQDTRAVLGRVARGELTAQLSHDYHGAYGEIAHTLHDTLASLRQLVEQVRRTTDTVGENAGDIADAGQTIARVAQSTRDDAGRMAEDSRHAGAQVRALAGDASAMSARTHDITLELQHAAQLTEQAAEHVGRTMATVDRLGTSSVHIGSVVQLIDGVARQSGLLAVNASVEAAKAGDAGNAFAVVAAEVKRLATQTRDATGDIHRMTVQVQTDIASTVTAMGEISQLIGQLQLASSHAATEMQRQNETSAMMARSMAAAADESDCVVSVAGHVSDSAVETAAGAGRFIDASARLNQVSASLQRLLAAFTV